MNKQYQYFIRVTIHPGYSENDIPKLEQFCSKVLGVLHTGSHNHWHFAVTTDADKIPCLRERIKAKCKWREVRSVSIKEWDGERKCLVYMFHEKDLDTFKIVSQKGYEDDEVKSFKEEAVSKKKKGESSRRKREPTFSEKLVDRAVEEFGTEYNGDDKVIMRWVMKQFGCNKKVWDEYVIYKAYNLVSQHVRGDAFLETAIYKLNTVAMRNCQDLLLCHK